MGKKKDSKTNAMRILDAAQINYDVHVLDATASDTGVDIARKAGRDPDCVFKTLVTVGKSGQNYVFMIPVAEELDLKKAASAAHEKSVAMVKARELFDLTGYVHGGCSPLGMKKFFPTFIDETCVLFDRILFSAGKIGMQIEMPFDDLARVIEIEAVGLTV